MKKNLWWLLAVILIIDQASKFWIKLNLEYGEAIEVFSWFKLQFIENPGMAWGVSFGGIIGKIALSIFRIGLIMGLFIFINRLPPQITPKGVYTAWTLILAGAIGNIIDSTLYGYIFDKGLTFIDGNWIPYTGLAELGGAGYASIFQGVVVDMLYFPMVESTFPEWLPIWGGNRFTFFNAIFNVADSSITIGFCILLWYYFFKKEIK